METITSADGTNIAYERHGAGRPLVLVNGALSTRQSAKPQLVDLLAPHLTVYLYDRRGRGDSGDTSPYAVEREIEDIEAIIDVAGGAASLYGHSSGASLALEATVKLGHKVDKLALYEAPYDDAPGKKGAWAEYLANLSDALTSQRPGDAVALFMTYIGTPPERIEAMRASPAWPSLEAVAATMAYDHAGILGKDPSVPVERARRVAVPTLVLHGEASFPFMAETARTLHQAIPGAELRSLKGQSHAVDPAVLAPILVQFLLS